MNKGGISYKQKAGFVLGGGIRAFIGCRLWCTLTVLMLFLYPAVVCTLLAEAGLCDVYRQVLGRWLNSVAP